MEALRRRSEGATDVRARRVAASAGSTETDPRKALFVDPAQFPVGERRVADSLRFADRQAAERRRPARAPPADDGRAVPADWSRWDANARVQIAHVRRLARPGVDRSTRLTQRGGCERAVRGFVTVSAVSAAPEVAYVAGLAECGADPRRSGIGRLGTHGARSTGSEHARSGTGVSFSGIHDAHRDAVPVRASAPDVLARDRCTRFEPLTRLTQSHGAGIRGRDFPGLVMLARLDAPNRERCRKDHPPRAKGPPGVQPVHPKPNRARFAPTNST